ncbi:MAG: hypothetical protein ACPLPR_01100 [Bacillota bacterium]
MRQVTVHARNNLMVYVAVALALLLDGCIVRLDPDPALKPGDLAGKATAVEWQLVTRFGERTSVPRSRTPCVLANLIVYLKDARLKGLPGEGNSVRHRIPFELPGGCSIEAGYLVRDFLPRDPGYLEFPQG